MGVVEEQDALAFVALQSAFQSDTGYWRAECPFCPFLVGKTDRRMSLAFKIKTQWYNCFRCGTKGKIKKVPDWMLRVAPKTKQVEITRFPPPESWVPLSTGEGAKLLAYGIPRRYLKSRGLNRQIVHEAGIGACLRGPMFNRIVVPCWSRDKTHWVGYSARDWTGRSMLKYKYPRGMKRANILYNLPALEVETESPLIATEGVFDALPYWPDAISFLGKPGAAQVEMLKSIKRPIAVVLDGDAWEEGWSLSLQLKFLGLRAGSVRLPPKTDPNDADREWLKEEARRCVQ